MFFGGIQEKFVAEADAYTQTGGRTPIVLQEDGEVILMKMNYRLERHLRC